MYTYHSSLYFNNRLIVRILIYLKQPYGYRTQDRRDSSADGQHFLPAFGPLFSQLGHHSRPPRLYQEADYLPELTPFLQTAAASNQENAMLGSGNFGVIPGGTYYAAGETASASDPYLYDGNSHGRPHRYVQGHRINAINRYINDNDNVLVSSTVVFLLFPPENHVLYNN